MNTIFEHMGVVKMLNNKNYSKETAIRIPINTVEVFRGDGEYQYSHFPFITYFNGQLIAMWHATEGDEISGEKEDILLSFSTDFLNWTATMKFPIADEYKKRGIIQPGGFYIHNNTMNMYFSTAQKIVDKKNKARFEDAKLYYITTENGKTFSEPVDMGKNIWMVMQPVKTSTGKTICAGSFTFLYTDDEKALGGFEKTSYLPKEVYEKYDDTECAYYETGKHIGLPVHLLEPTLLDYGNGNLKILFRSRDNREFVQLENELYTHEVGDGLYATDSTDGVNWSPVYRTEFTNNDSRFSGGRLSDGRFYIVSNPNRLGLRLPLVLSLSEDGENFDKHYIIREDFNNIRNMGLYKQYGCQYPHSFEHDGFLYVIYSVCKEDVHISRISLKDLK